MLFFTLFQPFEHVFLSCDFSINIHIYIEPSTLLPIQKILLLRKKEQITNVYYFSVKKHKYNMNNSFRLHKTSLRIFNVTSFENSLTSL